MYAKSNTAIDRIDFYNGQIDLNYTLDVLHNNEITGVIMTLTTTDALLCNDGVLTALMTFDEVKQLAYRLLRTIGEPIPQQAGE